MQVLKIVGALSHFGYRNKNGYFLLPNEALFLLEVVSQPFNTARQKMIITSF